LGAQPPRIVGNLESSSLAGTSMALGVAGVEKRAAVHDRATPLLIAEFYELRRARI
jgi:hypothetical protein